MEAYVLFPRSNGRREASVLFPRSNGRREASCEEQEEGIGCPSESEFSMSSSSEEELDDDASSSGSTDHFVMSSLMTQLPLKRGLSKFFDGKSQSFASLAAVGGLEDLAKPLRKRLKTSRSCGVGLQDAHCGRFSRPRCHNAAAATAAFKKVSRGRLSLLGAAPSRLTLRPVTASSGKPEALPGRALLFA